MAGFETWASFAGLPSRSATAGHALTFNPDHPTGAGHLRATKLFARILAFNQRLSPPEFPHCLTGEGYGALVSAIY